MCNQKGLNVEELVNKFFEYKAQMSSPDELVQLRAEAQRSMQWWIGQMQQYQEPLATSSEQMTSMMSGQQMTQVSPQELAQKAIQAHKYFQQLEDQQRMKKPYLFLADVIEFVGSRFRPAKGISYVVAETIRKNL